MKLDIHAVGDVSLGDHPVCAGHGMRSVLERFGDEIFRGIEYEIKGADINICNIETVTSNLGFNRFWLPSFEMRGNPDQLTILRDYGFNVFGVANNHAMQHGVAAFNDMTKNISNFGNALIGIDVEPGRTLVHEHKHECGSISAVVALSIRPEEWTSERPVPYSLRESEDALLAEVRALRERYDGFLICSIHWGLEFLTYPGPSQVELGRKLVDAGVDVVIGHHSHVLQPVERYGKGLIFYSLGNFVFDLWPEETKLTAIARIKLEQGKSPDFEIIPIVIGNDLKLRKAGSVEAEKIYHLFSYERYQSRTDLPEDDSEYETRYKDARMSFRYSSYRYFLSNLRKYPANFLVQSLVRTGLRRILGM